MTTTNTLPELDVEMIFKLIKWAEQDQRYLTQFAGWGTWDQGLWGMVPKSDAENILGISLDYRTMTDEEQQKLRNGACESAYCMAGQTVVQHGYRLVYDSEDESGDDTTMLTASSCIEQEQIGMRTVNGRVVPVYRDVENADQQAISGVAQELLGLTPKEADRLFEGGNGVTELKELANCFCEKRSLPLLFPNNDTYDWAGRYGNEDN